MASADLRTFMGLFQGNPNAFAEQIGDTCKLPEHGGPGHYHPIRRPMQPKDYQDHLANEATYGIYTVRPVTNDTCLLVWDIDTGNHEDVDRLCDTLDLFIEADQYVVEYSGRKGWHVWVFLDDWYSAVAAKRAARAVLQLAGLEGTEAYPKQDNVTDLGNLIKLPLGKHRQGKWSYFEHDEEHDILDRIRPLDQPTFAALVEEFKEPPAPEPGVVVDRSEKPLAPCTTRILEDGVGQGMRDHAMFTLAVDLKDRGYTEGEAADVCYEANRSFTPPLDLATVGAKIRSAYHGSAKGIACHTPFLHDGSKNGRPLCAKVCPRYKRIDGLAATEDAPEGSDVMGQRRQRTWKAGDQVTFDVVLVKPLVDGKVRLLMENADIPDLVRVELEAE